MTTLSKPQLEVLNFSRQFHPGMGQAVAERTILRRKENNQWETWGDVANRVALGNSLLSPSKEEQEEEYAMLRKHIAKATLLMSGRHLQHGDETQPTRNQEVFTNCATAATSFLLFYLLLNGCFRKGTLVKMADGSYKPIEEVQVDDEVVSFDEETKSFVNQKVLKLNENKPKPMVKVKLENGEEIICTADHKFLTEEGEWVEAQHLAGRNVKKQNDKIKVESVEFIESDDEVVYDLTVEHTHNYLVSESDIVVHNSGVGRCYDDDMMLVNWDYAPTIRCVLDENHADFDWSAHESVRDAKHKYGAGRDTLWFKVPDSREGWAQALEIWENAAFEKVHHDKMLILDFSDVRPKGAPIGGMQNRPASGPIPLMNAFQKAGTLKGGNIEPWLQAMYVDHYFAECVLVGGARRAARMSTKFWRDPSVLEFITVKRPIEYLGKSLQEIVSIREECIKESKPTPMGFLWSSNNSVTVDKEFWNLISLKRNQPEYSTPIAKHARKVFKMLTEASYGDGTGEPGIINVDRLDRKDDGWEVFKGGDFVGSKKFQIREDTEVLMAKLARKAKKKRYNVITNPCGEIVLSVIGGFCVIADVVPYHADTLEEAEEAFRAATRALIRVNTMDSIYKNEVERTNRIGVGITGIHEFAWKFFKLSFRDLIDEKKSHEFWMTMARFNRAVWDEAVKYSTKLGLKVPHTATTTKPAGTTSKLFGLTEGWHLPSMAWYMRWVQFRHDDPLVQQYINAGYPHRELKQYSGTIIIGFPTEPVIASLGLDSKLVTAGEATPEEQYKWLMLGEKYWIDGVNEDGTPVKEKYGNQISYTLKYKPELVEYRSFRELLQHYQSQVKACSVMPQADTSAYEYSPEQAVTKAEYEGYAHAIKRAMSEDISRDHVDCGTGGCPIDFDEDEKEELVSAAQ